MKRSFNFAAKLFLLVAILSKCLTAVGQEMPNVIPPSPEASAIFRYLDYPMNPSTGLPEISIPIYEVKSGSLSVPISLSYHASGRKVYDETGPVGLGWSLTCGGMISRTIHGKPDDWSSWVYPLKSTHELSNKNNYNYLRSIFYPANDPRGAYDSEYDIYSYYFGSNSGKFVFSQDKDSVYMIPLKPFLVSPVGFDFPNRITDDKGTEYTFGLAETFDNYGYITSKLLTSIKSADGKDEITFKYKSFRKETIKHSEEITVIDNYKHPGDGGADAESITRNIVTPNSRYNIQRLTEIVFKEGKVVFNLEGTTDKVISIEIFNNLGEVIKSIMLDRSILDRTVNGYHYKLDALRFKGSTGQEVEKYQFEYYPTDDFFEVFSRDYWGYRNGTNQVHLIPKTSIHFDGSSGASPGGQIDIGFPSVNRTPSLEAKKGVLKKIVFPTGGSAEYSYEQNKTKYPDGFLTYYCSGLRVSQTKTTDNNGNVSLKTYRYGINESGFGEKAHFDVQLRDLSYETRCYYQSRFNDLICDTPEGCAHYSYRKRVYTSEFLPEIAEFANDPAFYPEVTEYLGTPTKNTGKVIYGYNSSFQTTNGKYSVVNYRFPGYPTYPFGWAVGMDSEISPRRYIVHYYLWNDYPLAKKEVFKNIGKDANNKLIYKPVKKIINTYLGSEITNLQGLSVYKHSDFPNNFQNFREETSGATIIGLPVFVFDDYFISIGKKELESTWEVTYTDNGEVSQTTTYSYNNQRLVSQTRQTKSIDNSIATPVEEIVTKMKYPFDLTSDAVHQEMVNKNMLNMVVEQEEYKNSDFLQATKTKYKNWGNNVVAPELVQTKIGASGYQNRLSFNAYDAQGNLQSVSKTGGAKVCYVYGYGGDYPIAKIENAEYAHVENALGGKVDVGLFRDKLAPTDSEVRTFLAPLRANENLQSAMVTTYTYLPLVGMTSSTDAAGRNQYFEYDAANRLKAIKDHNGHVVKSYNYKVLNPSFFSVAKSGSFTKNDCGPEWAGSTLTYTVPAGTYASNISQGDADAKAQNEVNTRGQTYVNENGNCFVYKNREVWRDYTKNDCGSGYLGSVERYTVEHGKHTSTSSQEHVDNVAQNDLSVNGQAYANSIGECRPNLTYRSDYMYKWYTKSCQIGYQGSQIKYEVAEGKYSSTYSKEDANAIARYDRDNYGQSYANNNGTCQSLPTTYISISNNSGYSGYDAVITFTSDTKYGSLVYNVAKGATVYLNVPKDSYNLQITLTGNRSTNFYFEAQGGGVVRSTSASFYNVQPSSIRIY